MMHEHKWEVAGNIGVISSYSHPADTSKNSSYERDGWSAIAGSQARDIAIKYINSSANALIESIVNVSGYSNSNPSNSNFNAVSNIDFLVNEQFAKFKALFKSDEYCDGEISKTQMFFEYLYEKNIIVFREVFSRGWLYVYKLSPTKLSDFICIAASMDYEMLGHHADALIVGAWSHKSLQVKDSVLRAMESWCIPEHLYYLDLMQDIDDVHVLDYRNKVAKLLRGG